MHRVYPISRPGKGAGGLTGTWRIYKPIVDLSRCTGCAIYALYCPENVVEIVEGKARIDYDYCKGCGICANECPVKAIEMVRE